MFDVGGVLEHTPATGWQQRWEARLSLSPGKIESLLSEVWRAGAVGKVSEPEAARRVRDILKLSREQLEELLKDTWEEYLGTLNSALADFFARLRPRYRTAIVSNSFVGARERERQRYRFEELCDTIVYSHEVGVEKPDPRIYRIACERLSVAPEAVVFLDDVSDNVAAAEALGMLAVTYRSNEQALPELLEMLARE